MARTVEEYLRLPYKVEVYRETDPDYAGWVARVPDLPGCITQGDTFEELGEMIEDAMRAWLETAIKRGIPVPEPKQKEEYSGRFNQRVPQSLHRKLTEAADTEGVSLNSFCMSALAEAVGLRSTQPVNKEPPDKKYDWESAAAKILETLDREFKTGCDLESDFSNWIDTEIAEFKSDIELGDIWGAIGSISMAEKILDRFGSTSSLCKVIHQVLHLLRNFVELTVKFQAPKATQDNSPLSTAVDSSYTSYQRSAQEYAGKPESSANMAFAAIAPRNI